ncbi:MAG TPA: crossover junction endodeoxyribonuclease RuvC [Deltaproteobacteria bacterium]|nr:crossover junction endodeoxyribonuclease RuvC [Deltaproteobacteria bacterium]HPP79700.1 crossover junction endodeoxyribonuclease RuvC [Deltaproteobacteria bacterium]
MRILGVDPGTRVTGYGILELFSRPHRIVHVCHGTIRPRACDMAGRLREIFDGLSDLVRQYGPSEVAVETTFHAMNAQSALKLGQARGAVVLAAALLDIPVFEYTPTEIKKAACGYGHAGKDQIHAMVCTVLNIPKTAVSSMDASDALAVGLCHASARKLKGVLG